MSSRKSIQKRYSTWRKTLSSNLKDDIPKNIQDPIPLRIIENLEAMHGYSLPLSFKKYLSEVSGEIYSFYYPYSISFEPELIKIQNESCKVNHKIRKSYIYSPPRCVDCYYKALKIGEGPLKQRDYLIISAGKLYGSVIRLNKYHSYVVAKSFNSYV